MVVSTKLETRVAVLLQTIKTQHGGQISSSFSLYRYDLLLTSDTSSPCYKRRAITSKNEKIAAAQQQHRSSQCRPYRRIAGVVSRLVKLFSFAPNLLIQGVVMIFPTRPSIQSSRTTASLCRSSTRADRNVVRLRQISFR